MAKKPPSHGGWGVTSPRTSPGRPLRQPGHPHARFPRHQQAYQVMVALPGTVAHRGNDQIAQFIGEAGSGFQ